MAVIRVEHALECFRTNAGVGIAGELAKALRFGGIHVLSSRSTNRTTNGHPLYRVRPFLVILMARYEKHHGVVADAALQRSEGRPVTVQIRRYRPADAAAVVALFRDTIRRVNIRDYTLEQVRAWAPDEIQQSWIDKLARRFTLVAVTDGQIVGFGDLEGNDCLGHLYTHVDHQRRGIGRAVLAALEAEARRRGCDVIRTEASITARPFFERQGYRVLREQVVVCRGVEFVNYKMEKALGLKRGKERQSVPSALQRCRLTWCNFFPKRNDQFDPDRPVW
jgi:putative acetyltransferase